MATFTDPHAFAAHVAGYGKKIEGAGPKALKAAALAATNDIRQAGARYSITRNGRKSKLGARFTVTSDQATIKPSNPGAWKIIEDGAKPHNIGPRGRRRRAVVVPGYGVFAHVHHPGTGSIGHPWEKGVAAAKRSGPKAYQDSIVKVFT